MAAAMFELAIRDMLGNNYTDRETAKRWLLEGRNGNFALCCALLDLEPSVVRERLKNPETAKSLQNVFGRKAWTRRGARERGAKRRRISV